MSEAIQNGVEMVGEFHNNFKKFGGFVTDSVLQIAVIREEIGRMHR